jgi:hypothetical protein
MYGEASYMVNSRNNSEVSAGIQLVETASTSNARVWVKPTFERLSLKDALSGTGCVVEGITVGSAS